MFKSFIKKSRIKSPWLLHFDCGSCNGCDIEVLACLTPVYDIERRYREALLKAGLLAGARPSTSMSSNAHVVKAASMSSPSSPISSS